MGFHKASRRLRIGVISDTHIPAKARAIPARVLRAFEGTDRILHAGDLVDERVIEELGRLAPTDAVAGNNDPPGLVGWLGLKKLIDLGPVRIGLVHGHRGRGRNTPDRAANAFGARGPVPGPPPLPPEGRPAAVVFGHSHLPLIAQPGTRLYPAAAPLPFLLFNPGSPTDRRHAPRCSFGTLVIEEDGSVRGEIVYL